MTTIKELSESIGISKVGLNKWIERNGYKDQLEKVGNKYVIPDGLERDIRLYFDRRDTKPAKVEEQTANEKKDITEEILSLLREQLESKDREIERLHQQVDDLQKVNTDLVKAVRELNTISYKAMLTEGTPNELREDEESPANHQREKEDHSESVASDRTESEPRKKSLWNRLKSIF